MNYRDLLNIKYSIKNYLVLMVLLLIIIFIIIGNNKITDVYKTLGYTNEKNIIINIPINNTMLSTLDKISIEDNYYYLDDLIISDILLDENNSINYQEIVINSKYDIKSNLLVPVTIYYNEEKVLEKIKKLVF